VIRHKIPSKMVDFIGRHHVLALATVHKDMPSLCSVFYAFMLEHNCFVFASEKESEHIKNIMNNAKVGACIHDEVRDILAIKGLQVKGEVARAEALHEDFYLKTFPEAQGLTKDIWVLKFSSLKFTDNENIGFGQKEVWKV